MLAPRFSSDPFCFNFYIWCEVGIQRHSFVCGNPVVPAPLVNKTVFPFNYLGTHVEKSMNCKLWVSFSS